MESIFLSTGEEQNRYKVYLIMKKWEYLEIDLLKLKANDTNEFSAKYDELNRLGAQGWEVVSTNITSWQHGASVYCALLKRVIKD